jgi:hypothetical protein
VKRPAAISIGLAALLPASGYMLNGSWAGASASLALGAFWLAGLWRGWQGTDALGLLGLVAIAGAGVWLGLAPALMLAGVVAALAGWDLDRFAQRLRRAEHVVGEIELARAHLRRLLVVAGIGLGLGGVTLVLQMALSFGWALLLGMLAILGLSRAIRGVK